jgi:hypothetical protein
MSRSFLAIFLLTFIIRKCFCELIACEFGREQCACIIGVQMDCLEYSNEEIVLNFNELKLEPNFKYHFLRIFNKKISRIISFQMNQTFLVANLDFKNNKMNTIYPFSFEKGLS